MDAQPDLAGVAELLADRSRARMLLELVDGAARPARHLARIAGVSASTASSHLSRLEAAGFVGVEASGRTRRYRITDPRVVTAIEALLPLARTEPPTGLRAVDRWQRLRVARSCYDHLAGTLGADLLAGLLERGALVRTDGINGTAPVRRTASVPRSWRACSNAAGSPAGRADGTSGSPTPQRSRRGLPNRDPMNVVHLPGPPSWSTFLVHRGGPRVDSQRS